MWDSTVWSSIVGGLNYRVTENERGCTMSNLNDEFRETQRGSLAKHWFPSELIQSTKDSSAIVADQSLFLCSRVI